MIALDTSALLAILLGEPAGPSCLAVIKATANLVICAGTMTEARIVCGQRGLSEELASLLNIASVEVVPVTLETTLRCAAAYRQWGRNNHPAKLNFGDCFAYALAKSRDCPLLFVGDDFSETDIIRAL